MKKTKIQPSSWRSLYPTSIFWAFMRSKPEDFFESQCVDTLRIEFDFEMRFFMLRIRVSFNLNPQKTAQFPIKFAKLAWGLFNCRQIVVLKNYLVVDWEQTVRVIYFENICYYSSIEFSILSRTSVILAPLGGEKKIRAYLWQHFAQKF